MGRAGRAIRVGILSLLALFFLPEIANAGADFWYRLASLLGFVTSLLAIRMLVGAVLIVRDDGLRIQKLWPLRRDIPWYRILSVDVVPGFWHLEIELNSGERLELPPVADLDGLYRDIERHRTALDA
jgi:hypothetical protein